MTKGIERARLIKRDKRTRLLGMAMVEAARVVDDDKAALMLVVLPDGRTYTATWTVLKPSHAPETATDFAILLTSMASDIREAINEGGYNDKD